ncbi:hypothetical protein [Gemmata sp.]|uniref:hypothetical protein n=1 Tax=Gemmata sp. TaxID=1914242 RepID=UPI003F71E3AB
MEPFPDDIARFLDSHVESVDQLEILRVLAKDQSQEWTAAALAGYIQAEPHATSAHLTALGARGLVRTDAREQGVVCRYAPATPELAALLHRLLKLYNERPVSMIRLVDARRADPVRALANAFRLRQEGN